MNHDIGELARRFLHREFDALPPREQEVLRRIAGRRHISRDVQGEALERLTPGQRAADRVAAFGGSWTFVIFFMVVLLAWMAVNTLLAVRHRHAFDPYPFILLNLVLSTLAALQAPIIMMSQNRQAAKDREAALHDYEVNLKAELEILDLHRKLDELRAGHDRLLALSRPEEA